MPAANKGVNETLALGFVDGTFMLVTKTGKIDQHIKDAHKSAAVENSKKNKNIFFIFFLTKKKKVNRIKMES